MAAEEAEQQTTLRSLEQARRQAAEAEAAAATEQQQLQEQVGSLFTLCIWSTAQTYTENAPLLSQEDQPPACFPGRGLSECLPAVSQCSVIHADTFVLTPLSKWVLAQHSGCLLQAEAAAALAGDLLGRAAAITGSMEVQNRVRQTQATLRQEEQQTQACLKVICRGSGQAARLRGIGREAAGGRSNLSFTVHRVGIDFTPALRGLKLFCRLF